jgi:mono/diheme cytochrome c family protein
MGRILLSLSALAVLSVCSGVLWVGYGLYTTGFSAKVEPLPLEVTLVRQMRRSAIPSEIRDMPNPVPGSPEALTEGLEHFADYCAICHANNGNGDTVIGKYVYPRVPDLRLNDTQSMSDGELFFAIHNGIRLTAMPAWGERHGEGHRELEAGELHTTSSTTDAS